MDIGQAFISRCKALIRAKHGSVNAFCAWVSTQAPTITKWQIINTLGSQNPRIIQMDAIASLLGADLEGLLFQDEISLSLRGVNDDDR
jgi:hypothetical protein